MSVKIKFQKEMREKKRGVRWEDMIKDILEEKRLHLETTHLVQSILNIKTNSKHPGDTLGIQGGEEITDTSQVTSSISFVPFFSFSPESWEWGCFPGLGLQVLLRIYRSSLCDSTLSWPLNAISELMYPKFLSHSTLCWSWLVDITATYRSQNGHIPTRFPPRPQLH